jgi:hypothetical protein
MPAGAWESTHALDYDPQYYQAFYVPGQDLTARVYARLAEADFVVELSHGLVRDELLVSAAACSCGAPVDCEHRTLLALAVTRGLRSQRTVVPTAFVVRRAADAVSIVARIKWPPEVGPRSATVYGDRHHATVRLNSTGQHPAYVVDRAVCTCGQPQPCLHRQLVNIALV